MGQYGRYRVTDQKTGRKFDVEPISKSAEKGADWGKTDLSNRPIGGAVHPDESMISEGTHKNIVITEKGVSPMSVIDEILEKD